MSNKNWNEICDVDKALRKIVGMGMWDYKQTLINIRMIGGFELFNTRRYHCYENWCEGYEITSPLWPDIVVTKEDLDDAIKEFAKLVQKKHNKKINLEGIF